MNFQIPSNNGFLGSPGLGFRFPLVANSDSKSTQEPVNHRSHDIECGNDGLPEKSATSSCRSVTWNFNVPLLGRMRILKDRMGLVASSIVVLYWVYGNWSTWLAILIPRYLGGQIPVALLIIYAAISVLCITSFVRVSTMNPGALSSNLEPQADWNVCQRCFLHRPSHTHHCRRCGHCVRKMDHHCPWINNCVGEDNQFAFMLLLAYAYCLSIMTLALDVMHMYFMPPCLLCDKESFVVVHQSAIMWTAVAMAILMTCGAFGLYFGQHISVLFDTPSMEWNRMQYDMFVTGKPPEKWPQQKDTVYNVYRTVCGPGLMILWPFPCRRVRSPTRPHLYV